MFARLAALLAVTFASGPTPPQWIAVTPVASEAAVQQLARAFDLRGRYQEIALAIGDGGDLARLQRRYPNAHAIGAFRPDERLWVVTLLPGDRLAQLPGMRVLEQDRTQAIVAVPASAALDAHDLVLRGSAAPFHDGATPVPARRMSPARSPPRPRLGGFAPLAPPAADPRVSALVSGVTRANLENDVGYYSTTFKTRRSDQPEALSAQADLVARFQALGLATTTHDFDANADNIVADLPGALEPGKVVIVGAHYDTISYAGASSTAPGADDNGSGTAAVLELARVLATSGQAFRYTVRFCLFASEEFGLVGSDAYSGSLAASGVEVVAMLNTDMNAYRDATDALDLDFVTNDTTGWLTDDLVAISQLYVPSLPVVKGSLGGGTSDHRSFYLDGFPAVFYFEDVDHYSPYIHGPNDTYGTSANDFQLATLMVQSIAAGLATYADPIDMTIAHAPLGDSEDSWNPYRVEATVVSHTSATVTGATLHFDAGAGEQVVALLPSASGSWLGEIAAQPAGTRVDYWLDATDSAANTERLPATGRFSFLVGARSTFYFEDFESGAAGYTHGGARDDWQLGTPAAMSTDPGAAFSGTHCFGNDLGGAGFDGEYRASANCYLLSPAIDASTRSRVHLRYARWLGVEDAVYDHAEVRVNGVKQWSNPAGSGGDHLLDSAWTLHDLDISTIADHNASVALRWKLVSDGGLQFGGWNVDDVELYSVEDGTKPQFWRDVGMISLATGGASHLELDLGASFAGRSYAVLGGISGTSPGFQIGKTHVDLNFDAITQLGIELLPYLPGFLGSLDAAGRATATLDLDPGTEPTLAGMTLHLVAVTLSRTDFATAPIAIELLP